MHLPGPLRAAVGLVATAAAEAKHLPDRAIELPMLAVSSALQASLRAQQRYARLAARGDEVLNRRPPAAEPPPWATFDDPVPVEELRRAFGAAGGRSMFDQLFAVEDPTAPVHGHEPVDEIPSPDEPPVDPPAAVSPPPARKAAAAKTPARKSASRKMAAKKTTSVRKTAARKTTSAAPKGPLSKPRHTAPSAFDNAGDDTDTTG